MQSGTSATSSTHKISCPSELQIEMPRPGSVIGKERNGLHVFVTLPLRVDQDKLIPRVALQAENWHGSLHLRPSPGHRMPGIHFLLRAVKPGIRARRLQQFVVLAHLGNAPSLDDHQPVRPAKRAQPVSNGDRRSPLNQVLQGQLNLALRLRIDRRRRFVENQDPRIDQQRAGNADPLPLPLPKASDPRSPTSESYPSG